MQFHFLILIPLAAASGVKSRTKRTDNMRYVVVMILPTGSLWAFFTDVIEMYRDLLRFSSLIYQGVVCTIVPEM